MAEEQTQAGANGEKKGGLPFLVVLGIAVVCLGAGAGGAFFLLGNGGGAEAAEPAATTEPVNPAFDLKERVVALEPFVVNVTGDGYPRYLKLKIELEADTLETREEVDARLAQIRDAVCCSRSSWSNE
jgi:flagellar basal body-associated protein FliL